jgi:hypothetical protein
MVVAGTPLKRYAEILKFDWPGPNKDFADG